jgi:hypothetical protein
MLTTVYQTHLFPNTTFPLFDNKEQIIKNLCEKIYNNINGPHPHIYRKQDYKLECITIELCQISKNDILEYFKQNYLINISISSFAVKQRKYRAYDHVNYWGGPFGIFVIPIIIVANVMIYALYKNSWINTEGYYHRVYFISQTDQPMTKLS